MPRKHWALLGNGGIESSNLSFTATFYKRKPLIFLEKVGGLWFLASEKGRYGANMGPASVYRYEEGCPFCVGQLSLEPILNPRS